MVYSSAKGASIPTEQSAEVSDARLIAELQAVTLGIHMVGLDKLNECFSRTPAATTCIETIGGDPDTALRLSFQIKVF